MDENEKEPLVINSPTGDGADPFSQNRPEGKEEVVDDTSGTSIRSAPVSCGCSYVVEPALILYTIAGYTMGPLSTQYTYAKMAEHLGRNYTNLSSNNHHTAQCDNSTNTMSDKRDYLQQQVSLFSTYQGLAAVLPVAVMFSFYGAYSDRFGRKTLMIIPPLGVIVNALVYMATMYFDLPIYTLLLVPVFEAFGGADDIMILATFAYIADICAPEQRAFRMTVLQVVLYFSGGLAEFATGYWIEYLGFFWPFLFVIGGKALTILYVILFIPQTTPKREENNPKMKICSMFSQSVLVYTRKGTVPRRSLKLVLLTISYLMIYLTETISIIRDYYFTMNAPLCWDSVHIGYYRAAFVTIVSGGAICGIRLLSRCLSTEKIILLGLASGILHYCFLAMVNDTLMMYFAPVLGVLHLLPISLIRSAVSGLVRGEEQGAVLAALMVFGATGYRLSSLYMFPIYSATITFMPGSVFLVTAASYLMSATSILIYLCLSRPKRTNYVVVDKESVSTSPNLETEHG